MSTVTDFIEVHVPIYTVCRQWGRFDGWPSAESASGTHDGAWGGSLTHARDLTAHQSNPHACEARQVTWRGPWGDYDNGKVRFEPAGLGRTVVRVDVEVSPEAPAPAELLRRLRRRIRSELERFKEFVEQRGYDRSEWRGEFY